MKNNNELSYINSLMNDKIHESQMRAEILQSLKGLKYWLFLLGF